MRYKKPPKTFLVNEVDVVTIDYDNDSDEEIFTKDSIFIAANKILDKNKKPARTSTLNKVLLLQLIRY